MAIHIVVNQKSDYKSRVKSKIVSNFYLYLYIKNTILFVEVWQGKAGAKLDTAPHTLHAEICYQ